MSEDQDSIDHPSEQRRGTPLSAVIRSVASAAFGVQTAKNQERDFSQGNYHHFIIGGIVFTIVFVLTIVMVVRTVLSGSG